MQKDRSLRRSTKRVGKEDEILACLPVILVNIAKANSGQAQRAPQPEEGYLRHVIASTDGRIFLHEAPMQELSSDFERVHGLPQFCVVRTAEMLYSYSDSRDPVAAITL